MVRSKFHTSHHFYLRTYKKCDFLLRNHFLKTVKNGYNTLFMALCSNYSIWREYKLPIYHTT